MLGSLDTNQIRNWRSIVTLIVFIFTNIIVLFPFHIPIYIPRPLWNGFLDFLSALRVIPKRKTRSNSKRKRPPDSSQGAEDPDRDHDQNGKVKPFVRLNLPMNFVTAPLIADLFLLAILAIGRQEVHDGTIGANNISPIDIMVFFISLAYIAISIDASGLIRWLAFKVLQKAGERGDRLFLYLYVFFFSLGSFIGNDPIILTGTPFLAYMTRVSSNIRQPRAWIYSQFAIANIASAILVSSNPTNLVLASAFDIKFLHYTANIIVPVVVTAILLFPFLLYVVFRDRRLIPHKIIMHELPEEAKQRMPVNPNIPHARGNAAEEEKEAADDQGGMLPSLEEILNPFLDKGGAGFGAVIMAATLITVLAINAASQSGHEHPVFWVTLPAAFVMFCWDVTFGWLHRKQTRDISRMGREEIERARTERANRDMGNLEQVAVDQRDQVHSSKIHLQDQRGADGDGKSSDVFEESAVDDIAQVSNVTSAKRQDVPLPAASRPINSDSDDTTTLVSSHMPQPPAMMLTPPVDQSNENSRPSTSGRTVDEKQEIACANLEHSPEALLGTSMSGEADRQKRISSKQVLDLEKQSPRREVDAEKQNGEPTTLVSLMVEWWSWSRETFPTVTTVFAHLPFALVPFAICMFVLVQALVTKGWVPVFAYGWDHWVNKTGTVGAIGGMAFLSVILCNFAGTNIGTTILLSRVIQAWQDIHHAGGTPISNRMFWATVYSMALGVNYGAFSTAFSAALAGLLWRDILHRKHIRVGNLEFARVNLPIIAFAMIVGCAVLIGEIYIMRDNSPYNSR
ncbi:putative arsenite efflux transporter ArsB-like protein [Rhizodiscina lignyota]|uniref:Arsenite efflux transporter ArsB-like protein n=1 Tax=Rhizodiscina lignyota TaxID=1504668 RepID=A0A9P4I451_9PEZI|nr:putative arsenite efflux transporter ArsB-like protein [Rhizodiscina lignyota]